MRTNVYVDAFNLYYGSLKGTPYRWLNLEALLRRLLIAGNQLQKIKYYTAHVGARPDEPDKRAGSSCTCAPSGPSHSSRFTSATTSAMR